jgi:hypothetical protein
MSDQGPNELIVPLNRRLDAIAIPLNLLLDIEWPYTDIHSGTVELAGKIVSAVLGNIPLFPDILHSKDAA